MRKKEKKKQSSVRKIKQIKILNVKFVTELSEVLWSSENGMCAHVFRRATATSKARDIFKTIMEDKVTMTSTAKRMS